MPSKKEHESSIYRKEFANLVGYELQLFLCSPPLCCQQSRISLGMIIKRIIKIYKILV